MSDEEVGRLEAELVQVKALIGSVLPSKSTLCSLQTKSSEPESDISLSCIRSGDEKVILLSTELEQMQHLIQFLSHGGRSSTRAELQPPVGEVRISDGWVSVGDSEIRGTIAVNGLQL